MASLSPALVATSREGYAKLWVLDSAGKAAARSMALEERAADS